MLIDKKCLVSFVIWLLIFQGILNIIFSNVGFSAWKQCLILALFFYVISFGEMLDQKIWCVVTLVSFLFLTLYGVFSGLSFLSVTYNLFFYVSWIPFFFIGRDGVALYFFNKQKKYIVLFLMLSAIGLYIDLTTEIFSFLGANDIDNDYLETNGIAKRAAFIFNTSTTVMPILCSMASGLLFFSISNRTIFLVFISLVVAAYCTGSLSASICLIFLIFSLLKKMDITFYKKITFIIFCCFVLYLCMTNYEGGNLQIDRIFSNNSTSESNEGRLYLWGYAVNLISNFNFLELLIGKGIGVTNDNLNASALYLHGESSFFQALIEGGIFGFTLRIFPFLLYFFIYRKDLIMDLFMSSILISIAVAPIFGNITLQCFIGLLVGSCAYIRNENTIL